MTIHADDPFATPEEDRSRVRRLRGRLAAPVTLWTAYAADGRPAGLTVSSTLVADGEPGLVFGVLDEESELWAALQQTGLFTVQALGIDDRQLADIFAGLMPAPGGAFAQGGWRRTGHGPVREASTTWVGCTLRGSREAGWGRLVEGSAEVIELASVVNDVPLIHYRGRYRGAYDRQ